MAYWVDTISQPDLPLLRSSLPACNKLRVVFILGDSYECLIPCENLLLGLGHKRLLKMTGTANSDIRKLIYDVLVT